MPLLELLLVVVVNGLQVLSDFYVVSCALGILSIPFVRKFQVYKKSEL